MRRRYFVPEVIQTSAMDCGPAALKSLFAGFNIYLSYGRLREACQTDVDGTSIDTLEEIAGQLGMRAEQSMLPADLLLLESSSCLPAIVVVRLPDGGAHFVVLWRVHGSLVQVMDPAAGRIWMHRRRFLSLLYLHEQPVSRVAFEEWSSSEVFRSGIAQRMAALGLPARGWAHRAHLDAALRLAGTLREAGKLRPGADTETLLALCAENPAQIPAEFWTARGIAEDDEQVLLRGAVLLTAAGPLAESAAEPLPESLANVRSEAPPRVWEPVQTALRESGLFLPGVVGAALVASAFGIVVEALLFRGLFDLGSHLELGAQRLAALAALLVFLGSLLALDWPAALASFSLGRQLELRLRTRFCFKIPRLPDRYFQSRLISDMAFRAHWLSLLRELPEIAGQLLRTAASLLITAVAIAWLYPGSGLLALLALVAVCAVPALFLPAMVERDLRFREISASLSRFYLDSLIGSRAIQAHCAERTLRAAQAHQLRQWADAGLRQQALIARADAVQMGLTFVMVVGLVYGQIRRMESPAGLLLLIYWAISILLVGRHLATVAWSLPGLRNTLLRFLEPLGSPEQTLNEAAASSSTRGVKIEIEDAAVVVAGHPVLEEVTLRVAPGEHVGIVGSSGAGKSSLVGLLLGWFEPSQGSVRVDDASLDPPRLDQLRKETAWIDPQVHLFRAPLFDNLCYGNGDGAAERIGPAMKETELLAVLKSLPDGLQTPLGEAGGLVSGGEGQRVRMGRAMARPDVRLVILDEPARGLERTSRRRFLATARKHFSGATLLFITHDISDTLDLDRVLVVEQGRILEQGAPKVLYESQGSRYRQLLDQEKALRKELWSHALWRRLRLQNGVLGESLSAPRGS